jgi:hypothetical protein
MADALLRPMGDQGSGWMTRNVRVPPPRPRIAAIKPANRNSETAHPTGALTRRHHRRRRRAAARRVAVVGEPRSERAGARLVIPELFEANRERVSKLFDRTLDVIEAAFEARCTLVVKGALVDSGPDLYARIEAGKQVLRLVSSRG